MVVRLSIPDNVSTHADFHLHRSCDACGRSTFQWGFVPSGQRITASAVACKLARVSKQSGRNEVRKKNELRGRQCRWQRTCPRPVRGRDQLHAAR